MMKKNVFTALLLFGLFSINMSVGSLYAMEESSANDSSDDAMMTDIEVGDDENSFVIDDPTVFEEEEYSISPSGKVVAQKIIASDTDDTQEDVVFPTIEEIDSLEADDDFSDGSDVDFIQTETMTDDDSRDDNDTQPDDTGTYTLEIEETE